VTYIKNKPKYTPRFYGIKDFNCDDFCALAQFNFTAVAWNHSEFKSLQKCPLVTVNRVHHSLHPISPKI